MNAGMHLTQSGIKLLGKAIAGKTLHFTRGMTGDGVLPGDVTPDTLTQIISPKQTLDIQFLRTTDQIGTAEIVLEISNKNLETGYFVREYGILAEDPDTHEEVLYSYVNKGELCSYLEAPEGHDYITFTLSLMTVIHTAEHVTATIVASNNYVTHETFKAGLADLYAPKLDTPAGVFVYGPDNADNRLRMLSLSEFKTLLLGA